MFCPNPGVMAAGAQGKTYEDWLAHIAVRAPTAPKTEGASMGVSFGGIARVQMGTASGTMQGSPWTASASIYGAYFAGAAGRAVGHSLPSEAELASQRADARVALAEMSSANESIALSASARNGYTSASATVTFVMVMDKLSYWDAALNKPMTMMPYTQSGPVDYSASGW